VGVSHVGNYGNQLTDLHSLSYLLGACEVDRTYDGPKLPQQDGKYHMTQEFIQEMIEWFKQGKFLPKRYAWEIVMGAHDHFVQEESLVDVEIPEGVTIDVIGDVHGAPSSMFLSELGAVAYWNWAQVNSMMFYICSP
jgi:hypothetical protein